MASGEDRLRGFQIALLVSAIGLGLATTTPDDWSRPWLFGALVLFALISQPIPLTSKKIEGDIWRVTGDGSTAKLKLAPR